MLGAQRGGGGHVEGKEDVGSPPARPLQRLLSQWQRRCLVSTLPLPPSPCLTGEEEEEDGKSDRHHYQQLLSSSIV